MYFKLVVSTVVLLTCFAQSVFGHLTYYSNTSKGSWCFSDCVPYGKSHYCYTDWKNWDYCTRGNISVNPITSDNQAVQCTSHCGRYNHDYNWCLSGAVGSAPWQYCTPKKSFDYDKFEKSRIKSNMFQGWKKTFYTDPGEEHICPANIESNTIIKDFTPWFLNFKLLDKISTTKKTSRKFKYIASSGIERGFYQYATPSRIVSESIAIISSLWPDYVITPPQNPSQPLLNQFVAPAPFIPGQPENVPLTHFIHAQIYRRHLGFYKHRMPGCRDCHMDNLNRRLGNDSSGHLLAVSLGAGQDLFNIIPTQTDAYRGVAFNSFWRCTERALVSYLQPLNGDDSEDDGRHVEWRLVVHYGNIQKSRRPTGYFLQITYFDGQGAIKFNSPDMYYSNQ